MTTDAPTDVRTTFAGRLRRLLATFSIVYGAFTLFCIAIEISLAGGGIYRMHLSTTWLTQLHHVGTSLQLAWPMLLVVGGVGWLWRATWATRILVTYAAAALSAQWLTQGVRAIDMLRHIPDHTTPAQTVAFAFRELNYALSISLVPTIILVAALQPELRSTFASTARGFAPRIG